MRYSNVLACRAMRRHGLNAPFFHTPGTYASQVAMGGYSRRFDYRPDIARIQYLCERPLRAAAMAEQARADLRWAFLSAWVRKVLRFAPIAGFGVSFVNHLVRQAVKDGWP